MNLYEIHYVNDDGASLDLIIQAATPQRAFDIWREDVGNDWLGEDEFAGPLKEGAPEVSDEDVLRVFQITPEPGVEGALGWDEPTAAGNVKLVAFIYP